jgi:hypothetical protein
MNKLAYERRIGWRNILSIEVDGTTESEEGGATRGVRRRAQFPLA